MTISYSGSFFKLLFRWRGSVWKAVWFEMCVFLLGYFAISIFYRTLLRGTDAGEVFEKLSVMFDTYLKFIPLTFLLGFYINAIVARWHTQFELVAWPDDMLLFLNFLIDDPAGEYLVHRRQIARYLCLTCALAWRDISTQIRQRLPTLEHVVECGLMTRDELSLCRSAGADRSGADGRVTILLWQMPIVWAQNVARDLFAAHKTPPPLIGAFMTRLYNFKDTFRALYCYDWVCIPLAYTQVTAVATYGYFAFCLIGRQFLDPKKKLLNNEVDFYIPIFTMLQFVFFIGWFKVGQDLIRPFGMDDDDVELNYILGRHVQIAFSLMKHGQQQPPLVKDRFWDDEVATLSHSRLSAKQRIRLPKLHAFVPVSEMINTTSIAEVETPNSETTSIRNKVKNIARSACARHESKPNRLF